VTGGKYYSLVGVDRLFESLQKKEEARKVYEEKRLWNSPLFFALFVALLTTEWVFRKKWQLL